MYFYNPLILIITFLFFSVWQLKAQPNSDLLLNGMLGQTGIVNIPVAHLDSDKSIAIGSSYIPLSATVRNISTSENAPEYVNFARLNFLPFLELSVRFTKTKGIKELGDRSIFARVQVLKERKYLPAIAIGAHDLFGQVPHYHSLYLVTSKELIVTDKLIFNGHLGYGLKTREKVKNTQLLGLFGGGTLRYTFFEVGIEYDGLQFNSTLKLFYKKWFSLSVNLLDMNKVGGSAAVYFRL